MTLSISKLQQYAKTRGTKVIEGAYKIADDYKSAVFVLESGPKLTMTEKEIDTAIADAASAELQDNIDAVTGKPKAGKPKSKAKETE